MKKLLSILIILIMAFAMLPSCQRARFDGEVNVAVLNGTTGFGMAKLMDDNANSLSTNKYNFSVQTDASLIISGISSGQYDIAALPTNAAANLYNVTNGGVQIIAINTLGVLYLLEKGNSIENISDLEGKTVYCPAQNPTFIAKAIFEKHNVNVTVDSKTYAKPDMLREAVAAGLVDYAILPEPMVTIATKANTSYKVALDLTEEWNGVFDNELVQGCVVVRTEFAKNYPGTVNDFLKEYKKSINYLNENVEQSAKHIKEYGIFANENVAKLAIPNCNVEYMDGKDMKSAMSDFVNAMYEVAPASIGNAIPNDDFYYIP